MEAEVTHSKLALPSRTFCHAGAQAHRLGHHTITVLVEAICFVKAEFHHLAYIAFKLTILLP